jgi:hypothetical protein
VNLVHLLREHHIPYEQIVYPDEVHDSLLWRTWVNVFQATGDFFDRTLVKGEAIETVPPGIEERSRAARRECSG